MALELMDRGEVNVRMESEEEGDDASGRTCNMPCQVEEDCFERCDLAYGHGGSHQCPVHGSF